MQLGSLAFVLTVTLFSTHASADPLQKSEDIVKFFSGASEFGPARGICVGTEDECKGKKKEAPAEKTSLDMLINFGLDSAELDATARAELDEFAKALKDSRLSALDFVVEGYTDASGSAHYNEGLSERRARSVTTFLTSNGIDAARIKATGLGETNPRNPNPYDPVNRRVEMRIRTE
ncbi:MULTISPECIES: OmpA family protein [unclassified Mesorhizobium]|uniref:OmpA family protein n=1 Tax=unclassified Mesorhizobium TaxID=325217 RepID=UPI000F75DD7C|nr:MULTISPECIES: OmpA family protein [unclassified Mesorhizobium]AZO63670.1 OmpA family protein [Mesorhizobium sp. M6A.T.Cr.TU.016.01.1.1]RWP43760.1 MAG: OmpA family protein [Mesorhizobium sp.]RWQ66758.1 MAG: OmpA family protein [Mesorhizobium sp.]